MKEAIGNSFLITIVIVFLFLIMGLLISSLSYTKAYKAKNKIINVIEKYNGYTDAAEKDIYVDLGKMGYKINSLAIKCPDVKAEEIDYKSLVHDGARGKYHYCLYSIKSGRGVYYHVVTYMHFDVPLIGERLSFKVDGDSRTVYQDMKG